MSGNSGGPQCEACGTTDPDEFREGRKSWCKGCEAERTKERRAARSPQQKRAIAAREKKYREAKIFKRRVSSAEGRAAKKGLEFSITEDDLKEIYERQQGKCFYSNLILTTSSSSPYCLSVDRIDSTKGYTKDNVVLCCTRVNQMKSDQELNDFRIFIRSLYETMWINNPHEKLHR